MNIVADFRRLRSTRGEVANPPIHGCARTDGSQCPGSTGNAGLRASGEALDFLEFFSAFSVIYDHLPGKFSRYFYY